MIGKVCFKLVYTLLDANIHKWSCGAQLRES